MIMILINVAVLLMFNKELHMVQNIYFFLIKIMQYESIPTVNIIDFNFKMNNSIP